MLRMNPAAGHPWHLGFSKDGSILVVLAENRWGVFVYGRVHAVMDASLQAHEQQTML